MSESPILQLVRVSFAYQAGPGSMRPVLEDVSLSFERGRLYLVTGPSGSGKSTLLRLLNRLEEPTAGEIRYHGQPITAIDPPQLRRALLYLQQQPVLLDASVRESILLPFRFHANRDLSPPADDLLRERLDEVQMEEVPLRANAQELSVGQQQRLCLVRGLLLAPEVLLLDEPTSALDTENAMLVTSLVLRLHRQCGSTLIWVSHRERIPPEADPVVLKVASGRVSISEDGGLPDRPQAGPPASEGLSTGTRTRGGS